MFACPGRWLAILHGKKFNGEHCMQTFQSNLFIPAKLIGTIVFYHFKPLSMILTLAGGHKVSRKRNQLASIFHVSNDQDEV